jgi:hypothetical protein
MDDHRREALLKEYGEVSSNFRLLTDIRFKLLALLPIASAAAAVFKGDSPGFVVLSLFGLAATIGLVTYNSRNDQLYDELVGRAASIERTLGLADGAFANRPRPWFTICLLGFSWKVDHRTGIGTIYAASVALWLFLLLASILTLAIAPDPRSGVGQSSISDPRAGIQILALALAVLATAIAIRQITAQRKQRQNKLRRLAKEAVGVALSTDLSQAVQNGKLLSLCEQLSGEDSDTIRARASFIATVDRETHHYVPRGSGEVAASHLVAYLTDLSPQWIFDCATNRRRSFSLEDETGEGPDVAPRSPTATSTDMQDSQVSRRSKGQRDIWTA